MATQVSEAQARAWLSRFSLVDPLGVDTVESAIAGCQCLRVASECGAVVVALWVDGERAWINAAAGETRRPMTAAVLAEVERIARERGARSLGFQTVRRGLVRRAAACGYRRVSRTLPGFELHKELQ